MPNTNAAPSGSPPQIYEADDILEENKPIWIAFVGTSVFRGAFWATVDVLMRERYGSLEGKSTWKCWCVQ